MNFTLSDKNIDKDLPLIYMWEIVLDNRLVGRYVGKSKNGSDRPELDYKNNVRKLIEGIPYRRGNPDGFRKIHYALHKALDDSSVITLFLLCNIGREENINDVERHYINMYRTSGTEGFCLND